MKCLVFKKYLSVLTLIAFLFSEFLPFFATYDLSSPHNTEKLSSLFGDKILICTAEGFKWVSTADIEKGNIPKQHKNIKCPVCFIATHKVENTTLAALAVAYTEIDSGKASYAGFTEAVISDHHIRHYHKRGPPLFV